MEDIILLGRTAQWKLTQKTILVIVYQDKAEDGLRFAEYYVNKNKSPKLNLRQTRITNSYLTENSRSSFIPKIRIKSLNVVLWKKEREQKIQIFARNEMYGISQVY